MNIGEAYNSPWGQTLDLGDGVTLIFRLGNVIAGIIIVFLFIIGGYQIISGAGSGDAKAAAQGRMAVTYAIIGMIIVFVAYWIVVLVEFMTGNTFLTNPV